VNCPKCGAENPASNRFCDTCGAKLGAPAEKKDGREPRRREREHPLPAPAAAALPAPTLAAPGTDPSSRTCPAGSRPRT
jgi:hypothetical protein